MAFPIIDTLVRVIDLPASLAKSASNYFSTFDMIALELEPGLWLVIPVVFIGPIIALSYKTIQILAEKYPNNPFFQKLKNASGFVHIQVGEFLSDFGFAWNLLLVMQNYIYPNIPTNNLFSRAVAPTLAAPVALFTSSLTCLKMQDKLPKMSFWWYLVGAVNAAMAPSNVLYLLTEQGIISSDSYIIAATTVGASILGALATFFYTISPYYGALLSLGIEILLENLATSELFFELFPDISGAIRHGEVTPALLFGSAAGGFALWVLLDIMSVLVFWKRWHCHLPSNENSNEFYDLVSGEPLTIEHLGNDNQSIKDEESGDDEIKEGSERREVEELEETPANETTALLSQSFFNTNKTTSKQESNKNFLGDVHEKNNNCSNSISQ